MMGLTEASSKARMDHRRPPRGATVASSWRRYVTVDFFSRETGMAPMDSTLKRPVGERRRASWEV